MKNLATIILICLSSLKGLAQISSAYKTQVETIFQVDRSYVTTGLLQDYGILFTNVSKYKGVRSDSSYADYLEWQSIYNSIYTCRFTTTATLADPSIVYNQIATFANQNTNASVFAGLHYRYERFKSNAVSSNLVYISNNKIYDRSGRPTTPYEVKEAFSMVPLRTIFSGANHNFLFKPELFYSNTGKTISNLKVDFNDGAGYRTVATNVILPITYTSAGEKNLIFKITYTDGSVVESHTKILVENIPTQQAQARYAGLDTAQFYFPRAGFTTKAYNGSRGGALVTVEFANPGRTIRKPLIILSGLDGWKIRSPDDPSKNWSFKSIIDGANPTKNGNLNRVIDSNTGETFSDKLDSDGYDLIFVDYSEGTDYIQRNAYVLESVIQWINSVKQPYNGVAQKNVIMGFSMGGLVIRYALCDMEKAPAITHEVRLNVSFDSPHQGSNIPIGFQAATLHLAGSGIPIGVPGSTPTLLPFGAIFSDLGRAALLANAPASRQLLRYQVVGSGDALQINNTQFDTFMAEYHALGLPVQGGIRNISIADGSECGTKQPFAENASFVNINDKYKLSTVAFLLGLASDPASQAFDFFKPNLLGIPTLTDIKLELRIKALSNQIAKEVYYMKLSIRKKILGIINIDIILLNKSFSSNATLLALDNAPGGIKDLNDEGDLSIPLVMSRFCHVPTFSALDISGGTQTITAADLTKPYSAASPPPIPYNVRVNNFMTNPTVGASSNEIHTQMTLRNGQWLLSEIQGTPAFSSCSYVCSGTTIRPIVSGPSAVCNANTIFTLSNITTGSTINWTNSSNITYVGGQGTTSYTVKGTGSGVGSVGATISGTCGNAQYSTSPWVGIPSASPPTITHYPLYANPFPCLPSSTSINYGVQVSSIAGASSYTWQNPELGWNNVGQTFNFTRPYTTQSQSVVLIAKGVNACGEIGTSIAFPFCRLPFSISPNPATDILTVTANEGNDNDQEFSSTANSSNSFEVSLLDNSGNMVIGETENNNQNTIELDVKGIKKGAYVLQIKTISGTSAYHVLID